MQKKRIGKAGGAQHKKNKRRSTKERDEFGKARKQRDRGQEGGDLERKLPRRRPKGFKGPWPPKHEWALKSKRNNPTAR